MRQNPSTCAKTPRYGPHESSVMNKLLTALDEKGVIEPDYGPYGAIIVLAAKPNQGHVHWSEYVFRLCVSYRALNAITRPFNFPIPRCDDAAQAMGPCEYSITSDLDSGYWQVKVHEGSKDKTGFFTPDGKRHWKNMPMGIKNAAAFFVCMMLDMKREWDARFSDDTKAMAFIQHILRMYERLSPEAFEDIFKDIVESASKLREEDQPGSAIIIDDLMLYAKHVVVLLAYFVNILETLQHYRVSIRLRKTRFLARYAEFVGIDTMAEGNSPARSKYDSIRNLTRPMLFGDLRMLIGLFGFYSKWITWFEATIIPWRELIKI